MENKGLINNFTVSDSKVNEDFKITYDHSIVFDLNAIEEWVFKDGDKTYRFNKEEFIKRFLGEQNESN
jgi:hypothetical protein